MKKFINHLKEKPNKNGIKRWEFIASIVFAGIGLFFIIAVIYTFIKTLFSGGE